MKLTIELVPRSCFYDNARSMLPKSEWDAVRKQVYGIAGSVCQICGDVGPKHPVEAHEIWEYDDSTKTQRLVSILALCPACHQVKHIGLAQVKGKFDEALKHFMKINKVKESEALKYIKEQFKIWTERSKSNWLLDISKLKDYGVDVDKLTLK